MVQERRYDCIYPAAVQLAAAVVPTRRVVDLYTPTNHHGPLQPLQAGGRWPRSHNMLVPWLGSHALVDGEVTACKTRRGGAAAGPRFVQV